MSTAPATLPPIRLPAVRVDPAVAAIPERAAQFLERTAGPDCRELWQHEQARCQRLIRQARQPGYFLTESASHDAAWIEDLLERTANLDDCAWSVRHHAEGLELQDTEGVRYLLLPADVGALVEALFSTLHPTDVRRLLARFGVGGAEEEGFGVGAR